MAAGPTTREARRSSRASIARMAARLTSPFRPRSPKPSRSYRGARRRKSKLSPIRSATGLNRDRDGVYYATWRAASAYRGYNRDIETYVNPLAAEDPGQPQVTSRIGDGFNLDGKIKPNDFVSPDGEKGIDNDLYRAWGCDAPWRGGTAMPRWYCAPTTRCWRACTPSSSGSRAIRTR